MEMEKRKFVKRCKHDLVEGTCSLCLGVPRSKDQRDLLESRGGNLVVISQYACWFSGEIDDELVQASACSLL